MSRGKEDSGIIKKYKMQFINDFLNGNESFEVYMTRVQREKFNNILVCGNTLVNIRGIPKSKKQLKDIK